MPKSMTTTRLERRQHDVLGFEIAVHQPGGVDRFETRQQLRGDLSRPTEVQRPLAPQELGERGAVHELHRHHLVAVLDNQVEHPADVWRDDLARGCAPHAARAPARDRLGPDPVEAP